MQMPLLFLGHGSPMIALEDTRVTRNLKSIADHILHTYGKPKAILCISAHWYTKGSYINVSSHPEQIYDMYGFPKELYEVKYTPSGDPNLAHSIANTFSSLLTPTDAWGIDHGIWTVLKHMFPHADIPCIALSVNGYLNGEETYAFAKNLRYLRDENVLIIASGNIVHNLRELDYQTSLSSPKSETFRKFAVENIQNHNFDPLIRFEEIEDFSYVAPTPDHYLPLLYILANTTKNDTVTIFNDFVQNKTLAMTSFMFEKVLDK